MIFKWVFVILISWLAPVLGYLAVDKPYDWAFPRDHGVHQDYQVEWWYFTGHLQHENTDSRFFGFELTFFRVGNDFNQPKNPWSFDTMYITHFAVTDEHNQDFYHSEWAHREMPGLTESTPGRMAVKNGPYALDQIGDVFKINADSQDMALNLSLKSSKPIIFHGDNGFHQKTPQAGSASYYYSMTRLLGDGSVRIKDQTFKISQASAWMDHEIFTPQSTNDSFGWDWFAIQFDDGSELMVYQLRDKKRDILPTASGSFIHPDGTKVPLKFGDYSLTPKTSWTDPKTGSEYPIKWRVQVPSLDIDIITQATMPNQVIHSSGLLQKTHYWEGRCKVTGSHSGNAYIELGGY